MAATNTRAKVGEALLALGALPLEKRGSDYRIACGLVKEARGYLDLRNERQAARMLDAARPYMKAAGVNHA